MIKNVIFDFGNVIGEWNEDKIAANYAENNEEKEILKKVIFKSDEWLKLDSGVLTYQEAIPIFKEKLPDNLKEKVEEIMSTWREKMSINKDICGLIKRLKEHDYKVYLLSNAHVPMYEYVKNLEIGKCFDGILISAIEKMMKPNEEIYYRLFEMFGLLPEECFFIDDNEKNIISSRKCGMNGHIFDMNDFQSLLDDMKKNGVEI